MLIRILWSLLLTVSVAISPSIAQTPEAEPAIAALRSYEEGKRAYDAGDHSTALRRFNQAIGLDPQNPRWHYNLGLAHRKLENHQAAAQAFRRVRELDPDYKRAEIDDKLASMGISAGGGPSRLAGKQEKGGADAGRWIGGGLALVVIVGVVRYLRRRKATARAARVPGPDMAQVGALEDRLVKLGARLVALEHAMRLGEDADLRALLERATDLEHTALISVAAARRGDGRAFQQGAQQLDEAEALAMQARQRAVTLHGEAALSGKGERVGCYFCARPLANADYRRSVPLSAGGGSAEVLACPVCAGAVVHGQMPQVRGSGEASGFRHWSEDPAYDPYLNRHVPRPGTHDVPAWKYLPPQGIGQIALLAAGGALTAGAAYAATRLLDLDAAREAGLAQEASRAAAERAAQQRRESRYRDDS